MIGASLENKPIAKKIAEEWIDYTLSSDIQIQYSNNLSSLPVNSEAYNFLNNRSLLNHYYEKLIPFKRLDRRSQNGFEFLWNGAIDCCYE